MNVLRTAGKALPLYLGTGLSAAVALLAIPVMLAAGGLGEWSAIAAGQAVGGAVAPLVAMGWTVTGPLQVAQAEPGSRWRIYVESLRTRGIGTIAALPIGVLITAAIVPNGPWIALIGGVLSTALVSLDASFYFLGEGNEWRVFLFTSLPRNAATLVGIGVVLAIKTAPISVVPWLTTCGVLIGGFLSTWSIARSLGPSRRLERARATRAVIRMQWHPTISAVSGGLLLILPTIVMGIVARPALPQFLFFDKVTKQFFTALGPAYSFLQGWVPRGGEKAQARLRTATRFTVVVAVVAVLGFVLLGPWIFDVLGAGAVESDLTITLVAGAIVGLWAVDALMSRITLVVRGQLSILATTALLGSAIGVAAVGSLGALFGAIGGLAGVAIGMGTRIVAAALLARHAVRSAR